MKPVRRNGLSIMISLISLLGKLKYIIFIAVLGGFAGNCCAIAVTTLGACCAAKLMDPSFTDASLGLLVGLTIGAGVLRGLLRFAEQYNNHFIAFKLLSSLRDRIFGQLRVLAPARLEGQQKGSLIAMLTADVETLEVFYAHTISPMMIALLTDGTAALLIGLIGGWQLGLVALCAYLVIGIAVPFGASAVLKKDGMNYRRQFSLSSAYFLDSVRGVSDIVMNGRVNERGTELNRQSERMNTSTVSMRRKNAAVSALTGLTVSLTIMAAAAVGIVMAANGQASIAPVTVSLVLLFSSFGPVLSLAGLPANLTQTFAAGDRILNFMDEKPQVIENREGTELKNFEKLEIRDLSFGYEGNEVLKNVDLTINKGEIVGLIGPSGCGKSTLLKLFLRFYDPNNGKVMYNGTDLKQINTASLHRTAVMVSQDTWLFDRTIRENLLTANPNATEQQMREACRMAAVDELIEQLPLKYETEAGLLGSSMSTGERQRIGLARAFLSGAPVLLLDEVTSNVDAINEGIILGSLKEAAKDRTIILVSHRESTIGICNKVYAVKEGRVEAVW